MSKNKKNVNDESFDKKQNSKKGGKPNGNPKPKNRNGDTPSGENHSKCGGDGVPRNKQDPFWYAKDAEAIKNIATLPWNEISGTTIGDSSDSLPGLAIVPYIPCPYAPDTDNNYATRAADAYYQYVAQGFSANFDFEAPDLLMTAIAASCIYAFMCEGKRAFGMLSQFPDQSNYFPKLAVKALGFDWNDLAQNKKEFVSEFNIRVEQVNSIIAVPKAFFINERWQFLSSYIFTGVMNDPEFATSFAYKLNSLILYDGLSSSTGTSLKYMPGYGSLQDMTVETYFNNLDTMISALTSDDPKSMFAALRRVYSDAELIKVADLTDDFKTSIVTNPVMSAAFHNADTYPAYYFGSTEDDPSPNPIDGYCLLQSAEGRLVNYPMATMTTPSYNSTTSTNVYTDRSQVETLLDMYDIEITPGNVLDVLSSKLVVEPKITLVNSALAVQRVRGRSELLCDIRFYLSATAAPVTMGTHGWMAANFAMPANRVSGFLKLMHIDDHPLIKLEETSITTTITNGTDTLSNIQVVRPKFYIGELNHYTTLAYNKLASIHNRCMYTLLAMPKNSKSLTR